MTLGSERAASTRVCHVPHDYPILPEFTSWPTFPFEGDLRVRAIEPIVSQEPPRQGEDPASCAACLTADTSYLWTSARWRVRSLDRPTGLPMVLILESRSHLDLGDLPNLLAAELGVMTVRLERAIRSLDGVARVHVNRWGDGSAHLHLWFLARPFGQLQLRGTFLSLWDDILPPVPEAQWRENLAYVGAWLAEFGGRSMVEPPHIDWQSPSSLDDTAPDPGRLEAFASAVEGPPGGEPDHDIYATQHQVRLVGDGEHTSDRREDLHRDAHMAASGHAEAFESDHEQTSTAALPAPAGGLPRVPVASAELEADRAPEVVGAVSADGVSRATDTRPEPGEVLSISDGTLTNSGPDGSVSAEASTAGAASNKAAKKAAAPRKAATPRKVATPRKGTTPRKTASKKAAPVAEPAAEGATEPAVDRTPPGGALGASDDQSDPEARPTVSPVLPAGAEDPEEQ